jgi:hypothetical protein
MRRRDFLVTVTGVAGALAGCGERREPETVTPAPVPAIPTAEPTPESETLGRCPALPHDADRYVCSGPRTRDFPVQLIASSDVFLVDTLREIGKRIRFVLSNSSLVPFATGPDWWTVARRDPAGWAVVDDGPRREHISIGQSDTFVWTVGLNGVVGSGPGHRDVVLDTRNGRHVFAVTGYHQDGDMISLLALFDLRKRWTDTRKE